MRDRKRLKMVLVSLFLIAGSYLVRHSRGADSIEWMNVFKIQDFRCSADVINYVLGLRIPIPIVLSLAEIADYWTFGDTYLISTVGYRVALVSSYALAILLASSSLRRMLWSTVLSTVFLWSTVLIHPGNPATYDIFFPACTLIFFLLLKTISSGSTGSNPKPGMGLLSFFLGFSLSMAELTRPFVLFVVPFWLFCSVYVLKSWRHLLGFLIPVLLLSGLWHAHVWIRHDQILWTNNSGFNVWRAWPMVEKPEFAPEIQSRPLGPDHWSNLNTIEHYRNSRRLLKQIHSYIREHPVESGLHILRRLGHFLSPQTAIYGHEPVHPIFEFYRPLVWIASLNLLINVCLILGGFLWWRQWQTFCSPENMFILSSSFFCIVLAVAEAGEEARLLPSVLPLMAAWPVSRNSFRWRVGVNWRWKS